jgi:hypothetical protein
MATKITLFDTDPAGFVINWPAWSRSVVQIYKSADTDLEELFLHPEHHSAVGSALSKKLVPIRINERGFKIRKLKI